MGVDDLPLRVGSRQIGRQPGHLVGQPVRLACGVVVAVAVERREVDVAVVERIIVLGPVGEVGAARRVVGRAVERYRVVVARRLAAGGLHFRVAHAEIFDVARVERRGGRVYLGIKAEVLRVVRSPGRIGFAQLAVGVVAHQQNERRIDLIDAIRDADEVGRRVISGRATVGGKGERVGIAGGEPGEELAFVRGQDRVAAQVLNLVLVLDVVEQSVDGHRVVDSPIPVGRVDARVERRDRPGVEPDDAAELPKSGGERVERPQADRFGLPEDLDPVGVAAQLAGQRRVAQLQVGRVLDAELLRGRQRTHVGPGSVRVGVARQIARRIARVDGRRAGFGQPVVVRGRVDE